MPDHLGLLFAGKIIGRVDGLFSAILLSEKTCSIVQTFVPTLGSLINPGIHVMWKAGTIAIQVHVRGVLGKTTGMVGMVGVGAMTATTGRSAAATRSTGRSTGMSTNVSTTTDLAKSSAMSPTTGLSRGLPANMSKTETGGQVEAVKGADGRIVRGEEFSKGILLGCPGKSNELAEVRELDSA